MITSNRRKGQKKNNLLRYQKIMDEFNQHDCRIIPITVIWREFIYPKFHISRETLYRILKTPIEDELQELNKTDQTSLFN